MTRFNILISVLSLYFIWEALYLNNDKKAGRYVVLQDAWELCCFSANESLRSKSLMVPENIKSGLMSRCCSFKHSQETLLVLFNIMVSRSNRLANANVALRYVNTEKLNVKALNTNGHFRNCSDALQNCWWSNKNTFCWLTWWEQVFRLTL